MMLPRPGRHAPLIGREDAMDAAEIVRIKFLHRPSIRWIGGRVIFDCSCGYWLYPCPVRQAADEAETKAGK
jgi:hypothetical protein